MLWRKFCLGLFCLTLMLMIIIAILMPKIQITFLIHPDSGVTSEKLLKPKPFYLKEWKPEANRDQVKQQSKPEQNRNEIKPFRTYLEKRKFKKDINQRIVSIITGGFVILSIQNVSKIINLLYR